LYNRMRTYRKFKLKRVITARLIFLYLFILSNHFLAQLTASSCINSRGFHFLSDAFLGSIGACNCEKASVYISKFPDCNDGHFVLEFEDNFDGDTLDLNKWQNIPWKQGPQDGDQYLSVSTLNNLHLRNGICQIIARKEHVSKRSVDWKDTSVILSDGKTNLRQYDYTACIFVSKNTFHYGKFEIRCRMPKGNGFWPGFWVYGGQRSNEIDIIDSAPGTDSEEIITNVLHDYDGNNTSEGCNAHHKVGNLTEWHTYACIYEVDKIIFLFDNKVIRIVNRVTTVAGNIVSCSSEVSPGTYYQLQSFPIEPMYILVSMAVLSENGPVGSNPVDNTTPFPGIYEVDYVRFWTMHQINVQVSPNPTDGFVKINCKSGFIQAVTVTNLQGVSILHQNVLNADAIIDLTFQPSGIYILSIITDDGVTQKKVIKI
jgi:beta-glucanase (GH16 family)